MSELSIAKRNFIDAKMELLRKEPFFGVLLGYLTKVWDHPVFDTLATDMTHLFIDSKFFNKLSKQERVAVLVHEVMHCVLDHPKRLFKRHSERWNVACDYAINEMIQRDGYLLPKGALLDGQFINMSADEIYNKLPTPPNLPTWGFVILPGSVKMPQDEQVPEMTSADWRKAVNDAIFVTGKQDKLTPQTPNNPRGYMISGKGAGVGTVDVCIEYLNEQLHPTSGVPWKVTLRRYLTDLVVHDISFSHPNRRHIWRNVYMPGKTPEALTHLALVVDVSGSIDERLLRLFLGEIKGLIDEGWINQLTIIQCDDRVKDVQSYMLGEALNFKRRGNGGTRFMPGLNAVRENCQDAMAICYFTDLDNEIGETVNDPGYPTYWITPTLLNNKFDFGTVISLS